MTAVHTRLKFGPSDHGRAVTEEESEIAEYAPGYNYEIIDGGLYVSPVPNLPENRLERWLRKKLDAYSEERPDVCGWVTPKGRVFVADRPGLTVPEPDIAAYRENLDLLEGNDANWRFVSPFIVAEVLVDSDPEKDLVRNVKLYWEVPEIREYWILDGSTDVREPMLIARRRHGSRWLIQEVPYGETYRTPTLPGFELLVDPRK
jgi:Uma2 family endonuclease